LTYLARMSICSNFSSFLLVARAAISCGDNGYKGDHQRRGTCSIHLSLINGLTNNQCEIPWKEMAIMAAMPVHTQKILQSSGIVFKPLPYEVGWVEYQFSYDWECFQNRQGASLLAARTPLSIARKRIRAIYPWTKPNLPTEPAKPGRTSNRNALIILKLTAYHINLGTEVGYWIE